MTQAYVYEEGGKAFAEEGQVLLDGPDGVAVSMTPETAENAAKELFQVACEARNQISAQD
jgi:hypothetical protein